MLPVILIERLCPCPAVQAEVVHISKGHFCWSFAHNKPQSSYFRVRSFLFQALICSFLQVLVSVPSSPVSRKEAWLWKSHLEAANLMHINEKCISSLQSLVMVVTVTAMLYLDGGWIGKPFGPEIDIVQPICCEALLACIILWLHSGS